jgi:hypothetical protein
VHRTGYVSPYPLKTVEPLGGRAKGRSTSRDSGGGVRDHPFSLYTAARIEKAGNMSFFPLKNPPLVKSDTQCVLELFQDTCSRIKVNYT